MLLLASLWVMPAVAQNYPSKPIRLIVPSAPGGGIDFTGRVLALKLGAQLGQPVVVDNRAGASGILGADTVAKATPDGHTLLIASSSLAVIPSLYQKLPYDILRDFSPVSLVARTPNLLVVNPAVPARSVSELIALAKAQPAKLNFSSSGAGRASHMAAERFKLMAGINLTHVAYQGTGPAVTAVIAGEVELIFGTIPAVLPHVKSGRLRALGIGSLKRSGLIPEIPTIAETGLPGYEADTWYGLVAPAATPRSIVLTLNDATLKSLQSPDTRARFVSDGSEPAGSTPEEFQHFMAAEVTRWEKVVQSAGLRVQ
ncbi:MAG TPA: tripartite tricarboxylate transporter substrate binding protein [Burkholderiales bacterium]|jgi:tripartite-type tricarboxylate transporter receptor subunit TctC|nr:tripartite tricarboxylate transporter substrate binding protein [Burkholderiales bacterium]